MKKNAFLFVAAVAALVLGLSCGSPCPPCALSAPGGFTITADSMPADLTGIDVATADVRRLDSLFMEKLHADTIPLRAFNINTHDIMKAHGIVVDSLTTKFHVRGYLGLASDLKTFKLYILPVTGDSDSLITQKDPGTDTVITWINPQVTGSQKKCALELNAPCPNTCDIQSRLYVKLRR